MFRPPATIAFRRLAALLFPEPADDVIGHQGKKQGPAHTHLNSLMPKIAEILRIQRSHHEQNRCRQVTSCKANKKPKIARSRLDFVFGPQMT
jgi:hypothetical protein